MPAVETPLRDLKPRAVAARKQSSEFVMGTRLLGRGFGLVLRSPRLMLLGMVPAVVAAAVVLAAFALLLYYLTDLSALVTWFADDWSAGVRGTLRFIAGIAIVVGAGLLAVFTFTALTLLIGDPFYEAISKHVDDRFGGAPDAEEGPWFRNLGRNLTDSMRLLALTFGASVLSFLVGFVPVVGQTVVPVLDATIGGWFIAMEVSGIAFNRRGFRLRERRKLLGANRALALGFGIPVFLALLVPFAALVVMPGAVAGATLLTRRVLGQPHGDRSGPPGEARGPDLSLGVQNGH
jgi:CysZ protein